MTHNLCDKPEVRRIARNTGISIDECVGKLHRFWCWLDVNSVDGVVDGVVSTDVDDIVKLSGFADALSVAGWASFDDENETLTIPNFGNHNGETAKKRMQKNKRQARYRSKNNELGGKNSVDGSASTDVSTKTSTREEKRREEIKEAFPTLNLDAWFAWLAYRKKRKLANYTTDNVIKKLIVLDFEKQAECIQSSIDQNYNGLFPEKFADNEKQNLKTKSDAELLALCAEKKISTQGKSRYDLIALLEASQ